MDDILESVELYGRLKVVWSHLVFFLQKPLKMFKAENYLFLSMKKCTNTVLSDDAIL